MIAVDLLACEHLSKSFGGVKAVDDVAFRLEEGRTTGLIGGNGAGKTTLFNLLTGFVPADGGGIFLYPGRKQEIALYRKQPHEYAHLGIARTFQNIRLFETLSVKEHLILAKHVCKSKNPRQTAARAAWNWKIGGTGRQFAQLWG